MKKLITIFLFLMVNLASGADDPIADLIRTLDQQPVAPAVLCSACTDTQTDCPEIIVNELLNAKLTFMGRDLLPGSDQNRSCVFKGQTAYIVYDNCMGSKKEAVATSIQVISFNGGSTSFYVENGKITDPISTLDRSQYDYSTWRVSYEPSPPPGNLNMEGMKTYLKSLQDSAKGCYIGDSFAAARTGQQARCYGGYSNPGWQSDAEKFWHNPGSDWKKALQRLRVVVPASY